MFVKRFLLFFVLVFVLLLSLSVLSVSAADVRFCWDDFTNPVGTYYEVLMSYTHTDFDSKINNNDWDDVAATKNSGQTSFCYTFSFDANYYAGIFVAVRSVAADGIETSSSVNGHYLYGNIIDVFNDGVSWDEVYVGPDDFIEFSYQWSLHADQHDIPYRPGELPNSLDYCNLAPPWDNLDWYDYFEFSYHYSNFPYLPAS